MPRGVIARKRAAAFSADRQTMIGGTDIAPILGVSEKKTRFAVWAAKVKAEHGDDKMNEEEREAGSFYEPFILKRFGDRFKVAVAPTNLTFRRKAAPFLGANPDGLVYRFGETPGTIHTPPIGLVDAKTRSPFQRGLWGPEGSDAVPADELCQMQWYMEILDLPIAYLAVFFDRQLVVFVIHRDRDLGALAVEEATAFWNDYVVTKKEPPFEGAAAADYLRHKFKAITEPMAEASQEDDVLVAKRLMLKAHIDVLKARLATVEATMMSRVGAAPGIAGTGYVVRWGAVKAKTKVDRKAVLTELLSFPLAEDTMVARAVRDQIEAAIARHTGVGEATRTLKVYFKGPRALPEVEIEPLPPVTALLNAATQEDSNGEEE